MTAERLTRKQWAEYARARALVRDCPCMRTADKVRTLALPRLYLVWWVGQARFEAQARKGWTA